MRFSSIHIGIKAIELHIWDLLREKVCLKNGSRYQAAGSQKVFSQEENVSVLSELLI